MDLGKLDRRSNAILGVEELADRLLTRDSGSSQSELEVFVSGDEEAPARAQGFGGQLFFLVVDKLVIGAIVAGSIAAYDIWKTKKARDHEAEIRQVDLTFRRAEYVKEFLPTIVESEQEVSVRVESLRALVATGSISVESSVHLVNELLLDDVLGVSRIQVTPWHRLNPQYQRTLRRTDYPGFEEEFFVTTVMSLMPAALPALLGEHARVVAEVETLKEDLPGDPALQARVTLLERVRQFWVGVFHETILRFEDSELALSGSESLIRLDEIAEADGRFEGMTRAKAEEWLGRDNRSLKTIGAAHVLNVDERASTALDHLRQVVNPEGKKVDDLEFATEVVELLEWRGIQSADLSLELLGSIIAVRELLTGSGVYGDREAAEQLIAQASDYLYWAVRFSQTTAVLEETLMDEVREFVGRFSAEEGDGHDLAIDRALVRILSVTNSGDSGTRSEEAVEVLTAVYGMDRERLVGAGFGEFVEDWERGRP